MKLQEALVLLFMVLIYLNAAKQPLPYPITLLVGLSLVYGSFFVLKGLVNMMVNGYCYLLGIHDCK